MLKAGLITTSREVQYRCSFRLGIAENNVQARFYQVRLSHWAATSAPAYLLPGFRPLSP